MRENSMKNFVYSAGLKDENISVVTDMKFFAPECGSVLTAKVCSRDEKEDYFIDRIPNYTGYIKKNFEIPDFKIVPGKFYRFLVISSPYTKEYHNYFYVIPYRNLGEKEPADLNLFNPQEHIFLKRLGEFILGLGFDRKTEKLYKLEEAKRNWEWFFKTFDLKF